MSGQPADDAWTAASLTSSSWSSIRRSRIARSSSLPACSAPAIAVLVWETAALDRSG
jgi:hypothetical protein